ncbi:hypothetical protein QLX08_009609 [Tetragonisca angustula]|uniref:Uncharacterized protein n=1 Tax=Tetragonisca angustula TaxID=166442 RepID=A0AAW0ZFB9_9HYME
MNVHSEASSRLLEGVVNSGHFLEVFACLALFYEAHFPQRHSTTTAALLPSTLPSLFAGQFAIWASIELGQTSRIRIDLTILL